MGSGFIAYSIMMTIILLVGEQWIRRSGRSPEFFDSIVITLWVRVIYLSELFDIKIHRRVLVST